MKNLFFFVGILLCINTAYSQLNVRNDYYIYANDEVLFVTDNVNLQEADSKIYLRNDSQLVQGTGTTGNSGVGELSIQQNGTTNEYTYNYWCSPIGNNSASTGNENFRANLIDDATGPISSNDSNFTSNHNGTTSPLTISRRWIYTFVGGTDYTDWVYVGDAGNISPGLGYTMKGTNGSGNNQLYDFRGKPNNGTIANTIVSDSWTLIGNPYPSAIDALDFIHDTDNIAAINGTLYYWEQDLSVSSHSLTQYVGGYATYTINAAGTVETFVPAPFNTYNADGSINTSGSGSTSGKQARRYIPVGQGFIVEGNTVTSGIVRVKNSHREYYKQSDAASEFFRSESNDRAEYTELPDDYKRFRLNVDFENNITRQLVQTFHDTEATDGFDYGLESKVGIGTKDAYWVIEDEAYLSQALSFDTDKTIPFTIEITNEQEITIRLTDIQHFDDQQSIYIHDIQTNEYTNIRTTPFQTLLDKGTYNNRFEITFTNPVDENKTLSIETTEENKVKIHQNNNLKVLHISSFNDEQITEVTIHDTSGNLVYTSRDLPINNKIEIDTGHLSNGVYITQVVYNNKKASAKILVKN